VFFIDAVTSRKATICLAPKQHPKPASMVIKKNQYVSDFGEIRVVAERYIELINDLFFRSEK